MYGVGLGVVDVTGKCVAQHEGPRTGVHVLSVVGVQGLVTDDESSVATNSLQPHTACC